MDTRLHALSVLPLIDPEWQAEFEAATPRARHFADVLPLVRVVVPAPGHHRRELELLDVFRRGTLRPSHKSPLAVQCERTLQREGALYFHGGRPHPDYGNAVIVLDGLPEGTPMEVTPFGLGGMLCTKTHAGPHTCVAPVAHDDEVEQVDFTARSTWLADPWRARAAEYIGLYFGATPERYFFPGDQGRPKRPDPAGIFMDDRTSDWRAWTLEVRVLAEVNLFDALAEGRVIAWALDEATDAELQVRSIAGESWPFFDQLSDLRDRRIMAPMFSFQSLALIENRVRARCLP